MKKFRVLRIMDSTMAGTNQRVAIVELAEVEYLFSNDDVLSGVYTYGASGKKFIFDFNSYLARQIIEKAQNEEIVSLDLSEFRFQYVHIDDTKEEVGFHKSVPYT